MAAKFLTGALASETRMLWACIDPIAVDADPVAVGVLSRSWELAKLSPFRCDDDAMAALRSAGCIA